MIAWIAAAVAAGITVFLGKSRWNYTRLPELPEAAQATQPGTVTVIVPARNEAHQIERVVRSFPGTPVIVVNDHSTDNTAQLARHSGANVIDAPSLSAGAMGKPNACAAGARHARTDWLLFVDADTWYDPPFLPSLLSYAETECLDVATVFLRQHCTTWAERILLPYAFALYFCGVSAGNVNAADSREALANGQCLLVRRSAYERIDGHHAVRDSVIEDVALAVVAKRNGLNLRVLRAEHLGHVRMYENLPAIVRGFQKNSFRFLLVNPGSGAQVIFASVLLTSFAPVLAGLLAAGQPAASAAFALWPAALLAPWYGGIRRALLAPIAIYAFQFIALYGMASTVFGWRTIWKGRRV